MLNALPTGRASWSVEANPVIYPGWWAFKNTGTVGGPDTIDGTRTMAPSVVKVGDEFWMYYLAERAYLTYTKTYILRATAPVSDPTNFTPKNIAFEMPAGTQFNPENGTSSQVYNAAGPYHSSVLPWLSSDGSVPGANPANGQFYPWWMYLASVGNNTAVARSIDGGVTFQLVVGKNPLYPFEVVNVDNVQRRAPVLSESMAYDFGGCGSACTVRDGAGKFHQFITAAGKRSLTFDDLGAVAADVGHPDGSLSDIGIGYAESTDGVTFTRRTALSLGATSTVAGESGRIIEPRRWNEPNGTMEYIVSRPMVFSDGGVWRMIVSSHGVGYRLRSLHSTDLVNWTWDESPEDGFLGLGPPGTFDSEATAYGCVIRVGDVYHIWYTGNGYGHVSSYPTGIGYATATRL